MRHALAALALVLAAASCSTDPAPSTVPAASDAADVVATDIPPAGDVLDAGGAQACTAGRIEECPCGDGRRGMQTCQPSGVYGPCVCADAWAPRAESDGGVGSREGDRFIVIHAPSREERAAVRGPPRRASCLRLPWQPRTPNEPGAFESRETCEGVRFRVFGTSVEHLGATWGSMSPDLPNAGWRCNSLHTECLELERDLWVRTSPGGSVIEFSCRTASRRLNRRALRRAAWPCNEGDDPAPPPVFVRRVVSERRDQR